ncbi:hypothetical protein ACU4GD_29040 [Cupriavidus basilensis]
MTRFLRLCKIVFVILYYGLDELVLSGFKSRRIRFLVRVHHHRPQARHAARRAAAAGAHPALARSSSSSARCFPPGAT